MKKLFGAIIAIVLSLSMGACSSTNPSSSNTDKPATAEKTADKTSQQPEQEQQTNAADKAGAASDNPSFAKNATAAPKNTVPVTLVETVDGDTIKVNYKGKVETIRYLLIDTPEEKKPGTCVQPYAVDAYNRNKQLVNSGKLTLEFEKSRTDKYGRLLAYVFVDGKSVQETLLREGFARVAYIYEPPYKYLSNYQRAEQAAKKKRLNIWSKSGFATDRGFIGCVSPNAKAKATTSNPNPQTQTSSSAATEGSEIFANCTELRKKYPNGVPKGHPAYQPKMDRDKDDYACER